MRPSGSLKLGLVVCGGLLLSAAGAHAQERASIVGLVTDSTGAILPGVTVEASSPGADRTGPDCADRHRRPLRGGRPPAGHLRRHLHTPRLPHGPPRGHRPRGLVCRAGERGTERRRRGGDGDGRRRVSCRRHPEHADTICRQPAGARRAARRAHDLRRRGAGAWRDPLHAAGRPRRHDGPWLRERRSAHHVRGHADRADSHRWRRTDERRQRERARSGRSRLHRGDAVG